MTALINSAQPPKRSQLFSLIKQGLERHDLAFRKSSKEIASAISTADFDKLLDLAFLAISRLDGGEQAHKEIFVEACSELGLE